MKTIIILAMHGIPPKDFPKEERAEFFKLHSMVEGSNSPFNQETILRYSILDEKIRKWPRNAQNDPFYEASQQLAVELSNISGHEVLVGYNEFCSPSLEEALEFAVDKKAEKIIVVTTMMIKGGSHAEKDIPSKVVKAKESHPDIEISYAWPFSSNKLAGFLNEHISGFS